MSKTYKKKTVEEMSLKRFKVIKKVLSRKVRQFKDYIPSGSTYKKLFNNVNSTNYLENLN